MCHVGLRTGRPETAGGHFGIRTQERGRRRVYVWRGFGHGATEGACGDGGVEARHDDRDVVLVELLHGGLEVGALLALDEELCDLGAALHVLGADLANFSLLCGGGALAPHMRGAERVVGELALVLGLCELRLAVPELALLVRHVLPGEPNDLGQSAVVRLDLCGNVPALDEGRAEEDEGVRGSRNVVIRLLLPVTWLSRRRTICRREQRGCGVSAINEGLLRECARSDGRSKGDLL